MGDSFLRKTRTMKNSYRPHCHIIIVSELSDQVCGDNTEEDLLSGDVKLVS